MKNLPTFLNYANSLADAAGVLARRYFRAPMEITLKEGGYPVTRADKEIEALIRDSLNKDYPDHGILGEEYGEKAMQSPYLWVIDPIDGTTAFAAGKPTFSTLIALLIEGEPVLGIIDQPFLQERWVGMKGKETLFNGKVCKASGLSGLSSAKLNCTTPVMFPDSASQEVFARVRKEVASVSFGGDAYAYGLLASGYIDVIVEADLKFYDVAALVPILEGAGAVVSDWEGNGLSVGFDGRCVAAGSVELHGRVLALL